MSFPLIAVRPSLEWFDFAEHCPFSHLSRADSEIASPPQTLANEELRILQLLFRCGAQPAVSYGGADSADVAPGLTIVGREAGCPEPTAVAGYLETLSRAGLIWVSSESLPDSRRYVTLDDAVEGRGLQPGLRFTIRLTVAGERWCAETFASPLAHAAVA
ncbi:hypothetical protein DSM112329_04262 [Paraconexibacter sp. AEG42_29]|uniref:Uncharacterized protein n=1 Tax=Paraconexibacter sp. AEG42_29 TaxID=2997339 RepID=A0AAU7B0K2_9ACTN